jgi:HSP20 family protein
MTLVKFNNRPVHKVFNSVFDDLFSNFPATWNEGLQTPPVNIHETKEGFHLEVSAPGLAKEDFTINVEGGVLTVGFEKKEEKKADDYKTVRREFSASGFKRSFTLNEQVDTDNIQAKYENGILKLYLPKKEETRPATKQINVQ